MTKTVISITGYSGSGKTGISREIIDILYLKPIKIAGFISQAIIFENEKRTIQVLNLETKEEKPLAQLARDRLSADFGKWNFNQKTIEWVINSLSTVTNCDLLVMDEIGPLEIEMHKGWHTIFDDIDRIDFKACLITFRPKYTAYFQEKYPDIHIVNAAFPDAARVILNLLSNAGLPISESQSGK